MKDTTQEHLDWLKSHCDKLDSGHCRTRSCLIRDGWSGKSNINHPSDFEGTCIPLEIYNKLKTL